MKFTIFIVGYLIALAINPDLISHRSTIAVVIAMCLLLSDILVWSANQADKK